jgi:hypothetical protein
MKIYKLSPAERQGLLRAATSAVEQERDVRVAVDGDRVKIKIGGGVWSLPLGEIEEQA